MSKQSEAQRLADELEKLRIMDEVMSDNPLGREAATELRRLAEKVRQQDALIRDVRTLLIDTEKRIDLNRVWKGSGSVDEFHMLDVIRAAIDKLEQPR
jgi:polyhydroxyalkanoate synthesis regulator protein